MCVVFLCVSNVICDSGNEKNEKGDKDIDEDLLEAVPDVEQVDDIDEQSNKDKPFLSEKPSTLTAEYIQDAENQNTDLEEEEKLTEDEKKGNLTY